MPTSFYVYRFINSLNHVIYVGKTKENLINRFKSHRHLPDECYNSVYRIEYIVCKSESDMSIKEIYYINKYSHANHKTYNLLDVTAPTMEIVLEDEWIVYDGFLPEWFTNSLNVLSGYKDNKKIQYNKDGSISQRTSHRKSGYSYDTYPLNDEEVNKIILYFINSIKTAPHKMAEHLGYRNLLIFMTGIQYPIKITALLNLKYKDIFDKQDRIKGLLYQTNRAFKDYQFLFDLDEQLKSIYHIYREKYNLSYKKNSEDNLFMSRDHCVLTTSSYNRILTSATQKLNINKNVGGETLRKTYGFHVYNHSPDKIRALDYLEILFGQAGFGMIAKYIGVLDKEYNYNEFLTEKYKYSNIDTSTFYELNKQ